MKSLFKYPAKKENILLILDELQRQSECNCLFKNDILRVADYLGLSCGFVYGVATYYGMFSLIPRGKYMLKLCRSPVCHMMGSLSLLNYLCEILKIGVGSVTDDGLFSIELVECLGRCDKSPCMLVNDESYGDLNKGRVEKIISDCRISV